MHVILWSFDVKPGSEQAFEDAYGPHGTWAQLFELGAGYLGTELLRDPATNRFVTIDRWESEQAFLSFKEARADQYAALDAQCAELTVREERIGAFTQVS